MHNDHINVFSAAIWLPVLLLALLLTAYLAGVQKLRGNGKSWSRFRTICFISGIALIATAVLPPLADYAHHDLRGHMIQHLLIGMLAPLGLVLAAPLTLLLKILPPESARKVTSILASRPFHYLSHPITALLLNIGGMYLLYLSPLYAAMQTNMYIHYLVHVHFLAAGYLFIWSIAGPDPAPKRPSLRVRLVVLFISMASHAYLSKFMYAYHYPRNTTHNIEEIQDAAQLMYYGGDLAEVLLAIAFFSMWYRLKIRTTPVLQTANPSI